MLWLAMEGRILNRQRLHLALGCRLVLARGAELHEFLLREIGISPVWVCPFRTSDRTYDLCPLKP